MTGNHSRRAFWGEPLSDTLEQDVRRAPVQERSRKRVELILDETAKLLTEVGVDGVKTSEIARRADITLASLYRYFPNKAAIFKSLVLRWFDKIRPQMGSFLEEFNLDESLDKIIDTYARFYREEPGYAELWSGIQAIPGLQELDLEDLRISARMIADKTGEIMPHIPSQDMLVIATVVNRAAGAILRLELIETEMSEDLHRELKIMLKAYLKSRLAP